MKKFLILNNNHTCTLPSNKEYNFEILKACFDFSGTILQLMISLESLDGIYHDVILQEIELDSAEFEYFSSFAYAVEENEVIDFDLEAITLFSGTAKIIRDTKNSKVRIAWESVQTFGAPLSSAEKYKDERISLQANERTQKIKELISACEDDIDKTSETSDFMILPNKHLCTLPMNLEYYFNIIKASFSPRGDSLQMMILLENQEHSFKDIIYEEIPLYSDDFNHFAHIAYGAESCEVIDFCPDRLGEFFGTTFLKQEDNTIGVNWHKVNTEASPISSAGTLKLNWIVKDADRGRLSNKA